jgi:hypothetical protein
MPSGAVPSQHPTTHLSFRWTLPLKCRISRSKEDNGKYGINSLGGHHHLKNYWSAKLRTRKIAKVSAPLSLALHVC